MSLTIHAETDEAASSARITLQGRLDTVTALELEKQLEPLLGGRYNPLVFDLARLEFISSAGIRILIRARKTIHELRGGILMVNLQPQIAKVFEIIKALPGMSVFKDDAELDRYLVAMQHRVREGLKTAAG
jgi:anti-sigma B factor antagonist